MKDRKSEPNLDEIRALLTELPGPDAEAAAAAEARQAELTKPAGSLGRLEELAEWLAAWQGRVEPVLDRPHTAVFAGNHGVAAQGVSAYPAEVTKQMVANFIDGGAAVNQLCALADADLRVYEMALDEPTRDFTQAPAMREADCARALSYGMMAVEADIDVLALGEMGIGNTTPAAAIGAVVSGANLGEMVGRGTGVDDEGLMRKREAIRRGIEVNRPIPEDGLDVLAKIGGFEIGGIAGCVLAGAYHRRAVVIDGFISTSGALIAHILCPTVAEYLFAGHCSEEPGHRIMLNHLHLEPILDLGMRLGEGTGATLAMGIIDGAVKVFKDVLTFEEAGVANKESKK